MGDGMYIVNWIFKGMGAIFMFFINMIIRTGNELRFRSSIKQIERNNTDLRKVHELREQKSVSELLSGTASLGKTITTGDDFNQSSPWRNAITQKIVTRAKNEGIGAIVLHNNDSDLVARLEDALGRDVVVMDEHSARLDLICNLEPEDIVQILLDEENSAQYRLPESSFQYLETLLEVYKDAVRRMPCFSQLVEMTAWDSRKVNEVLERWVRDGYIESDDALRYQDKLVEFSDGRHKLNHYLKAIRKDLENVLAPTSLPYRERVTIRSALANGKVLTIDLQNVHAYKPVFGLICMLLEQAFTVCSAGLLVLSNISFSESPRLLKLITERNDRVAIHLSMADLTAKCGSKEENLNPVMAGSQCVFRLRHQTGQSCEMLSKQMGTYEYTKVEINQHIGKHKGNASLFGAGDNGKGFATQHEIRPRVQSGEISQQPEGVAYVTRAGDEYITHCTLKDA